LLFVERIHFLYLSSFSVRFSKIPPSCYVFILSRMFFHEVLIYVLLLNLSASLSLLKVSFAEMPLLLLLFVLLIRELFFSLTL